MSKPNICLMKLAHSFLFLLLIHFGLDAKVLSVEIQKRDTILNGKSWGEVGPYEIWKGKVFFGTDPINPANLKITDIGLAPTDENGMVRSSADLVVLKPIDQSKSTMALVEVSNRGGKFTPSYFLNGQGRLEDPQDAIAFGDGLLMKNGMTIIWVGWQFDLPENKSLLRFITPTASYPEGSPLIGLVRSDWTVDEPTNNLKLGHRDQIGYPVYDPGSNIHHLTKRVGRDVARITVSREDWDFGKMDDGGVVDKDARWIYSKEGFDPGFIYELVYHSKNPPIVGLGLSAVRDIISYAKYDPECDFRVREGIAAGVSQTGRFLRTFLYQGFNVDEMNRKAFDGMMIITAGAGRGSFNHRFAQPSRDGHRYSAFQYPTDIFPFTSSMETDNQTGASDGILSHLPVDMQPKIMHVNTGYEYWGRCASLIHTTPDGTADVKPLPNERIYHIASGQHYVDQFPPNEEPKEKPAIYVGNPLQFKPNYRALIVALHRWVGDNTSPPPSVYPTLESGTLSKIQHIEYPNIPGFQPSKVIHEAYRTDYGAEWTNGIISNQPPLVDGTYVSLAPAIDDLGNEKGGIRNIELLVPIATYIPYSLRHGFPGANQELQDFKGTFIPLPLKQIASDGRPSIEDLYDGKNDYMIKVRQELDGLVSSGYVLNDDVHQLSERASSYWSWIHQKQPSSEDEVAIMSFNIRYDNPGDSLSAWPNRKNFAAEVINAYEPDFLGLQEALEHQCKDVKKRTKGYKWFGVGREDGIKKGEFAPIFYRKKIWKVLQSDHFWLSETPEHPSKGWDAAHERIATWGLFENKKSGKKLYVLNTHFDHRGKEARRQSVILLMNKMKAIAGDHPFVIMGDFNFDTQSIPYLTMTTPEEKGTIVDSKVMSRAVPLGPEGTFSGFIVRETLPTAQIDHIFVDDQTRVSRFEVVNKSQNGRYPSDHFPVFSMIEPWVGR